MNVNKLENDLYESIVLTLKNYIYAWHRIPNSLDVNNINIKRIRYVKKWRSKTIPEDAFIVEFNSYIELIGRSELGLSSDEFKVLIQEQNKNGLLFAKDFLTKQEWYEYPVVFGNLDEDFDDTYYYEKGGKYEGDKYTSFGKKYD